jgi:hypothetical protein
MLTKGRTVSHLRSLPTDAELDALQRIGDPLADDAVAAIFDPWPAPPAGPVAQSADNATSGAPLKAHLDRVKAVDEILRTWTTNRCVADWRATPAQNAAGIGQPLERFVAAALAPLPPWVEPARLERAGGMFMSQGALSVTILFCASLPESYVVPDLATVLHTTGQLVHSVDHRIRSTGAMLFPALMTGGLTTGDGAGVAQTLKVRLIHGMIRNLILRGDPRAKVAALASGSGDRVVPKLATIQEKDPKFAALYVRGWDLACGVPVNQEEMAYTMLTFSYVFLRSLRRLGVPFKPEEERDYLHLWNVIGHILGLRRELMPDTMGDAEVLFARMQQRGRKEWAAHHGGQADPRPLLGEALMDAMESAVPAGAYRPFPTLMTRELLDPQSARDLGLDARPIPPASERRFRRLLRRARKIDAAMRRFDPDFSLCRLVARAVGYRLICKLLMDQTNELKLPEPLRQGAQDLIVTWGTDPKASPTMNALEDRWTTAGGWHPLK